jgi:hypothetical protein
LKFRVYPWLYKAFKRQLIIVEFEIINPLKNNSLLQMA